ncbi:MAG: gliding motility-associated C-terminal domain-containing protein [Chitinophagales bacterium]|nr:gliding motility-associated C-terminal domain-containing protein [Chitinophagales bacterium]
MRRVFLLIFFVCLFAVPDGFGQCNGLPTDCVGTQSYTVDPAPVNGFYNAGTVVTFCYTIQNYNQCNSNWFHTLDLNFGPGWDLSTITPISLPVSCDGIGNWNYYNSVTSTSTGQSFGPCFSYDSPLGFPGNVLDGNPGNNFGDNCASYTWTFCFSIMVSSTSYGQSLSVDATATGDGSAGSWTSNTCPGAAFNISNAFSQACFISATNVVVEPTCLNNDGSISLTVTGNLGPVSFLWSPGGQTTASISGLSAGSYQVTVSDTVNCEAVYSFDLTYDNPVTFTNAIHDAACFGYCDGIATIFAANGAAPYNYSWSGTGNVTSYDSALCAGDYYVTITDANYCERIDTITIGSPAEIQLTPTVKDVSCFGGYDGWATVNATGGSGIYFFNWQPSGQNSDTAKNLVTGTYTVTATDTKGCFADLDVTISSPPKILIAPSVTPVSCYGFSDGAITTSVSQGVAPYQYYWVNSGQVTSAINSLPEGSYSLLVTDDSGCQQLDTFYVSQPDSLTGILAITPPSCPSANDGGVAAVMTGGTTPYAFIWNNNPLMNTPSLVNLAQGYFSVLVTDANNCNVTIAEYVKALPDLVINAGMDVSIELGHSTILNAQVDRFGDFDFQWKPPYNLSDSLSWTTYAYPFQTTEYVVEVTDPASGCVGSDTVTVILLPSGYVLVPSAFTPNNDGLNDLLFPVSGELVEITSFKIFNRWGQVVFSGTAEGWDGTFHGKPEETAAYVYEVHYLIEGRDGQSYTTSGSVMLIR